MERPWRKVAIPDHVWDAFEAMAQDMGNERDALISQALFTFARQNGYLQPSRAAVEEPESAPEPAASAPPQVAAALAEQEQADAVDDYDGDPFAEVAPETLPKQREREGRLFMADVGGASPMPLVEPTDPERHDRATRVRPPDGRRAAPGGAELVLLGEDGSQRHVTKDRFVIGRGKHCDLVINSSKVSREHAHILREGDSHYIEDLDSSNGTWFDKARIRRRKIEDGDEYFICNERLKCQLLPPAA
jgi:hypothetical protein